jgi:hypothetical protein
MDHAVFSGSLVPHLLQKWASGILDAPHTGQAEPAIPGEAGGGWMVSGVPGVGNTVPTGVALFAGGMMFGSLISWLITSVMPLVMRRNSLSALPTLRPISGSFLGPKSSRATIKMNTMWMGWIPNDIYVSFQTINEDLAVSIKVTQPAVSSLSDGIIDIVIDFNNLATITYITNVLLRFVIDPDYLFPARTRF